jgi:NADPH:quinone reductase-like Zn-dependent oxidoreductase
LTGQLDLVIDCVGDDTLFRRSPSYLQPNGKFLSIVGRAQGIYSFLMHQVRPTMLGGTPRSYKILGLAPSGTGAREVAQLVNDGLVKEILVDSEYRMGDALLAYEKLATKRAKGKIVIRVQE